MLVQGRCPLVRCGELLYTNKENIAPIENYIARQMNQQFYVYICAKKKEKGSLSTGTYTLMLSLFPTAKMNEQMNG